MTEAGWLAESHAGPFPPSTQYRDLLKDEQLYYHSVLWRIDGQAQGKRQEKKFLENNF